jgi:hypothetical protein
MTRVRKAVENKHPVCVIEVKSNEQPHISLGDYDLSHPPKGFAIHISPDPEPDTIVTQITRLEAEDQGELILHVANYGNATVNVEVWEL